MKILVKPVGKEAIAQVSGDGLYFYTPFGTFLKAEVEVIPEPDSTPSTIEAEPEPEAEPDSTSSTTKTRKRK